jgi:hypothetical protein
MSVFYNSTPAEFQPVLSDGIYFTLSSDTYNPLTTFKFKYNYELYVEDQLVFEGKCSPNPYGLGILDLQQILETYTYSLPISYWNTTPIYTHQTFPFSRPANDEVINYYVRVGYEYADSELGSLTGYTGYGNSIGNPSVQSLVYKTFRSTMGTNGRATQQNFDFGPFVLSGTPQGVNPTTTGLFLTNAPRTLDVLDTDYFTLGFSNYYLWSGATTGLSEGYYVEYKFYDDQGTLLLTETYDNIVSNGGGPRVNCNNVYQQLYLIDPVTGTTDYNTLYVAAGPANLPNIPAGTEQYTVQLFGHFTGSTSPIQPTPTPTPTPSETPTISPTPSPTSTPYCSECTSYSIYGTGSTYFAGILTCDTGISKNVLLQPNLGYTLCSCTYPVVETDAVISILGPCGPTPTPSTTPTSTPVCTCREYYVENVTPYNDFVKYRDCYGVVQTQALPGFAATTFCACQDSVASQYCEVSDLGPCVVPTPTQTPGLTSTPTPTPTPSATPGCYLEWFIIECFATCVGGVCDCDDGTATTVYTNCSVTDITDPSTELYDSSALVNPWTGDFVRFGSIYNSSGSGVTLVCNEGGPC